MMYVVKRGYAYVDINGRNKVYTGGQEFNGEVDPTQRWKLGEVEQVTPEEVATKVIERSHIHRDLQPKPRPKK
jgi:hypothetical protein